MTSNHFPALSYPYTATHSPYPAQPTHSPSVEHDRSEQHAELLDQIQSAVLQGEGLAADSDERLLTAVRSPVALRRRAVPDDGAAGCLLDSLGGLQTQNCQVCLGHTVRML